jgi:hypothetical protein
MIRPWLIALLVTALVATVGAADDKCIRQSGSWGGDGPAEHLVVVNGHAFFGGRTLRVADLADPANPTVVHEVRLDDRATDLDTKGDWIFLVDGGDELIVIDAASPRRASIEDRFPPEEEGWMLFDLAFNGNLAVISGRTISSGVVTKLLFADISGPEPRPAILGSSVIAGQVTAVAVGTQAVVAVTDDDRVVIIDISDPSEPVVTLEAGVAYLAGPADVTDLRAVGDVMAVATTNGSVGVFDISDPNQIVFRGAVQSLDVGFGSLGFDGSTIHVGGSSCTSPGACGGYAMISLPGVGPPRLVGRTDAPDLVSPVGYGGFVLAAAFEAGVRIIDTTSPAEPQLLDAMVPAREVAGIASSRLAVGVVDTTTFGPLGAPARNTLRVLERAPNGRLEEVDSYAPEAEIWALTAGESFIAAAMYDEVTGAHSVEIIDITDPRAARRGSRLGAEVSIEFDTLTPHLDAVANMLYFSLRDSDDVVLHRVTAGRSRQVGIYRPGGQMVDFAAASTDLLAVAVRQGSTDWIEIVDTLEAASPQVVGTFVLPEPADEVLSLDAAGRRLGILVRDPDGSGGPSTYSIAVDATDATIPSLLGDRLPGSAWVALGAGILHTQADPEPWAPYRQRHVAIDLDDPSRWMSFEHIGPLDVEAARVDANGRYFNVSRDGRLEVYDYGTCAPIPVAIRSRSVAD